MSQWTPENITALTAALTSLVVTVATVVVTVVNVLRQSKSQEQIVANTERAASHADDIRSINAQLTAVGMAIPPMVQAVQALTTHAATDGAKPTTTPAPPVTLKGDPRKPAPTAPTNPASPYASPR